MSDPRPRQPRSDKNTSPVRRDINLRLLGWRILLALFLSAASALMHFFDPARVTGYGLVGSLGLLYTSLAVSWAAQMARAPQRILLGGQLAADTLCIALLVHFTGGPFSAFPLLFCVPIMLGASYLGARWSITIAGMAAITTGGGHFGLALGWLLAGSATRLDYLQGWPVLITALHVTLFLVVGLISGQLARRLAQRNYDNQRTAMQVQKARCEVRNILDNIRSGLITIDRKGLITRVNPSCCRILEMPEAELLGQDIRTVADAGLADLADIILPVAAGGESINRGEVVVQRLGRQMPLGMNVNPVVAPKGLVIGAIAIFTDLTREKEMTERMREADRLAAIGELAASIAHEIRNPLASIRGSVEILAGELDLEDYQGQLLDLVLKESARVNTIINDFLAYSRMRPSTMRQISGAEFRDEITLQIRQHIVAKNGRVPVSFEVTPDHMSVIADPGQLTQMVLNLAINSCEAMNYSGELRINLRLLDQGQMGELVVSDNGPGIEPEIRNHLFSPFKTTKETGTGLGLSVVAHIAHAHGGSAKAEEAPGGGATFRIAWPQDHQNLGVVRPESEVEAETPKPAPPVAETRQHQLV